MFGIINAQNSVDEKEFEKIKPMLFDLNKSLLNENDFVDSTIDIDFVPNWLKPLDDNKVDSLSEAIKKEAIVEVVEENQDMFNAQTQVLRLMTKYKVNKFLNLKFNVEIVNSIIVDNKNNQIEFKNLNGLDNTLGYDNDFKKKIFAFNFKDNVESPVKGRIKFKVSFLKSCKAFKVNDYLKDSIFEFQNSKYKIMSFKDNCLKFIGLDSLSDEKVKNINFVNLDHNLKEVIAVEDDLNSDINLSNSSTKISLPFFMLEEKVKYMTFEEYSNYLDSNKKSNDKKVHIIKFNVRIQNLYFYEECYLMSREFEIYINQKINLIKN